MRFHPAPLLVAVACGPGAHDVTPHDAPRTHADAPIDAPTTNPAVLWLDPADNETEVILSGNPPTFEF